MLYFCEWVVACGQHDPRCLTTVAGQKTNKSSRKFIYSHGRLVNWTQTCLPSCDLWKCLYWDSRAWISKFLVNKFPFRRRKWSRVSSATISSQKVLADNFYEDWTVCVLNLAVSICHVSPEGSLMCLYARMIYDLFWSRFFPPNAKQQIENSS